MDEFNQLLEQYKTQYLQFLSTGDPSFKSAYQNAQTAIEKAISSKREVVDSEKKAMKHFADSYQKQNAELETLAGGVSSMIGDAQSLHDAYLTSKQRYDMWTENAKAPAAPPVDVSIGYSILLRIGIFLVLVPILVLVGYYTPGPSVSSYSLGL